MEKEAVSIMNARTLLVALTLVVLALLTWQLRWVLLVIFGAVVVAVALDVLIEKLQSFVNLPRPLVLTIVLLLLFTGGSLVSLQLVPELFAQVKELSNLVPILETKIRSIIASEPLLQNLQQSLPQQFGWDRIEPVGTKIISFAGDAANSFIQFLLISLLAILLALDPKSHRKMVIAATPRPARQVIADLLESCRIALGGWLTGMTISATSIFILTWMALALLQVPLALLSSLVCGLLTFVPTIGPTIATLLPSVLALLVSPELMIEVLILRIILQNLEAFVLTPILLRRTVNLLPTVALTSQLSLGALLGLPGLILALPLVVVLQVCMQTVIVKEIMDEWE